MAFKRSIKLALWILTVCIGLALVLLLAHDVLVLR
jgi:hypothetical protein